MEMAQKNPLTKYFRQPAIFMKLPSDGRYWGEGALDLPENREIPVFPMSARDEISLKTPDALMNGQGVVDVIQSCCPNIKNAWKMPSIDVDAVLIAIRIATYGNRMSFDSRCTHCQTMNSHEIDLGASLAGLNAPNFDRTIKYQDLAIKLRPQHYFHVNKTNIIGFEEQKMLNAMQNSALSDEERAGILTQGMQRLIELGIQACAESTEYIELSDGSRVTDTKFINEFYENAEIEVTKELQSVVSELVEQARIPAMDLQCEECHKAYQAELQFDYANFFDPGF
jgi:hypothetical protein